MNEQSPITEVQRIDAYVLTHGDKCLQCGRSVAKAPTPEKGTETAVLREQLAEAVGEEMVPVAEELVRRMRAGATPGTETDAPDKRTTGLYAKFRVERTDGASAPGQKHDGCDYFVLDLTHDPHARPALAAYADSCSADYPLLARDLRAKFPTETDAPIRDLVAMWRRHSMQHGYVADEHRQRRSPDDDAKACLHSAQAMVYSRCADQLEPMQLAAAEARASQAERERDELAAWKSSEQSALLAMAAELASAGCPHDGVVEGVRWLNARREAAEARADLLQHERDWLRDGLKAARDAMAAFGKQAGWLPAQQAYACTMTQAEKDLADAVASLDRILAATPHGGTDTDRPKEQR